MSLNQKDYGLDNLKKAIQLANKERDQSLFVFDLDSTLFCMKYRTQAIIRDCVNREEFHKKFPEYIEIVKTIEVTEKDWSVEEIMSRYGFSQKDPVVPAVKKIWKKKFFTNDYLDRDKPYSGCVQFVQHIYKLGAKVFYLTARNHTAMYEGTVQSLNKWNFPLENKDHLIMKEETEIKDSIYKTEHLKKLIKKSNNILFFENEPVILNEVARNIPQVQLFWMNSTHSRQEEPPENALPLTMNYIF